MGALFSICMGDKKEIKTEKTLKEEKTVELKGEPKELEFETDIKNDALTVVLNSINVNIELNRNKTLRVKVVKQDGNEYWMNVKHDIYHKSPDSDEWRFVELYSSGKYFEREMIMNERLNFDKILENVVNTIRNETDKFMQLHNDIVSNTEEVKLEDSASVSQITEVV